MNSEHKKDSVIIEANDLYIRYDTKNDNRLFKTKIIYAVNGVSFSVEHEETFAIVGESGSGKTSIAMSILNFVKPAAGSIFFKGRDVWKLDKAGLLNFRRKIQPVFQDSGNSLNPRMSVGRAIKDGLINFSSEQSRREKAIALLKSVGLSDEHFERFPHQLSGGQKQRVCIARALAPEPEVLILDEPVSSQDLSIQAHIINLLLDLKKRYGLTYLLISHDIKVVRSLADRIAVMKHGKFVEVSESNEIFCNPKHQYTKLLLESDEMNRVK